MLMDPWRCSISASNSTELGGRVSEIALRIFAGSNKLPLIGGSTP